MTAPRGAATRVAIERRGGFAGLPADVTVEVAALEPHQRSALSSLLDPAPAPSPAAGAAANRSAKGLAAAAPVPDRFVYRIRVVAGADAGRVVTLDEARMPDCLARLARPLA